MGDVLFFILWILCVIGTFRLIKDSIKTKEDNIKIEIQPPIEINKRLEKLYKTVT